MPSPTKLDTIVAQNSMLRQLFREAGDQRTVNEQIMGVIGSPLSNHIRFALLREDTLILIADSSAWASKLRYQVADIQHRIAALPDLPQISNIRVKVAAASPTTVDVPRRAHALSEAAAREVRAQAQTIEDTELREALLKLAAHRNGEGES